MRTVSSPRRPAAAALSALSLSLLLLGSVAACGGGSSPTSPGGRASAASVEMSSWGLINQARRTDGRPDLTLDPLLSDIARRYSERMRDEGFFGHTDPSGGTTASRVQSVGVGFSILGENLALVSHSSDPAAAAHNLLMGNAEHRANILDGRFRDTGVGVATNGDTYWITQIFSRP